MNERTNIYTIAPKHLRSIRKHYFHFTLETVAQATNISVSTIRRIELGFKVGEELNFILRDFYARQGTLKKQKNTERHLISC